MCRGPDRAGVRSGPRSVSGGSLLDVHRGPGPVDRRVLGRRGAVEVGGGGEGAGAGGGVLGAGGELGGQRAVPDLLGLVAADAGDGLVVGGGGVVGDAVDRLLAAALGEQVEEVV